ncbi:hypothetical protein IWX90DRAFT_63234 [Phyllosticta citrichinensis]|uniref:Uncharacterized protein n=1 Tax=Phyllosticta citrichinensis TaxID=1130410 RepID=A0ABR1XH93_9PEZI
MDRHERDVKGSQPSATKSASQAHAAHLPPSQTRRQRFHLVAVKQSVRLHTRTFSQVLLRSAPFHTLRRGGGTCLLAGFFVVSVEPFYSHPFTRARPPIHPSANRPLLSIYPTCLSSARNAINMLHERAVTRRRRCCSCRSRRPALPSRPPVRAASQPASQPASHLPRGPREPWLNANHDDDDDDDDGNDADRAVCLGGWVCRPSFLAFSVCVRSLARMLRVLPSPFLSI